MNKIVQNSSTNCASCGKEVHSYQIRPTKVSSILLDCCPACYALNDAYKEFKQASNILKNINKLAVEITDSQISSPNIVIEPIDSNINAAVELLKRMDGSFFVGVSKIVAGTEANYGHTSSDNPTILYINLNRIVNETKGDNSKRSIICSLAETIAHEAAHAKSFDPERGFVGGESPSLAMEQKVSQWIKANESRLQDLFK